MTAPVKLPAADGVKLAIASPAASVPLAKVAGVKGAFADHWMVAGFTGAPPCSSRTVKAVGLPTVPVAGLALIAVRVKGRAVTVMVKFCCAIAQKVQPLFALTV